MNFIDSKVLFITLSLTILYKYITFEDNIIIEKNRIEKKYR